jgi:hypothetical protein
MNSWYTQQLTQCLSIPAADLPPANRANNATAYVVGPITANRFMRFLGSVSVGVLTGAANVSAYLQSCNTSNGVYVNISSTNAVSFTNTANTVLTVEARADQLPTTGTTYVQLAVLVAANSAFTQARVMGVAENYEPASQFNFNTNNTTLIQTVY